MISEPPSPPKSQSRSEQSELESKICSSSLKKTNRFIFVSSSLTSEDEHIMALAQPEGDEMICLCVEWCNKKVRERERERSDAADQRSKWRSLGQDFFFFDKLRAGLRVS
jgi:hypothetical protein